ncbi:hypothetical protein LF887_07240 [Chryseobacterium sp. MEBOG06]|uniref:hypothetical protein n=1 Tax=Chryseobacterium sp. MEBOG06 TaxID=2879938 RepID=UPI001F1B7E73|nr:hypothetical protein [Chryseobacterium sp. MEBOG06]UKB85407.1 hypothetical protein LF887_07240 [Chryseobacterium sp. MEBOG06]
MIINRHKELFGFQPYEFTSFLEGNSLIKGYKYLNQLVCDLLIYEKEGHYYKYEDENIIFYSPTEINENGSFFFKIKNKFLLTENESFQFYANFQIDKESLNIVMIEAVSKNNDNKYNWVYSTMDYLIETTNKRSQDIYIDYYPHEIAFVLNRFLLLKNVTKNDIINKLQSLKKEENLISGFYK